MAKGPGTYLYVGLRAKLLQCSKFTAAEAISLVNNMRLPHCTLMYAQITHKSKLIRSETSRCYSTVVTEVRYIPHADCTCLILEKTRDLVKRHQYFANMGLDLGYDFDPHVTVCQGNQVDVFKPLIGVDVDLGDEYIQVIVKE